MRGGQRHAGDAVAVAGQHRLDERQARRVGEDAARGQRAEHLHVHLGVEVGARLTAEVMMEEVQREAEVRDHGAPALDAVVVAQPVGRGAEGRRDVAVDASRVVTPRPQRLDQLGADATADVEHRIGDRRVGEAEHLELQRRTVVPAGDVARLVAEARAHDRGQRGAMLRELHAEPGAQVLRVAGRPEGRARLTDDAHGQRPELRRRVLVEREELVPGPQPPAQRPAQVGDHEAARAGVLGRLQPRDEQVATAPQLRAQGLAGVFPGGPALAQRRQRAPGPALQAGGEQRGGLGDRRELGVRGGLGVVDGHGGAA
jgi:hypothetical protein